MNFLDLIDNFEPVKGVTSQEADSNAQFLIIWHFCDVQVHMSYRWIERFLRVALKYFRFVTNTFWFAWAGSVLPDTRWFWHTAANFDSILANCALYSARTASNSWFFFVAHPLAELFLLAFLFRGPCDGRLRGSRCYQWCAVVLGFTWSPRLWSLFHWNTRKPQAQRQHSLLMF